MWTRTSSKLHETRTSPTRFVGLLRAPSPRFLCCVAQPRPSPDLLLHTSHKPCQLIYQTLEWVEALAWLFITSDAKLCHQHGWIDCGKKLEIDFQLLLLYPFHMEVELMWLGWGRWMENGASSTNLSLGLYSMCPDLRSNSFLFGPISVKEGGSE